MLFEMPIVGQLTTKIPAKYIMAFGWVGLAFGMYYSTKRLDLLISFGAASRLRMVQAFGLGFLFVPIKLSAYIGIPAEKGNSVSGMVNFMRNIGSSVGTSMVTTHAGAAGAVSPEQCSPIMPPDYDPAFRNQVSGLSAATGACAEPARRTRSGRPTGASISRCRCSRRRWRISIRSWCWRSRRHHVVLAFIVRKNDPAAGGHVVAE